MTKTLKPVSDPSAKYHVLAEVAEERDRQDEKWGQQDHPDGTSNSAERVALAYKAKALCDDAASKGRPTWNFILTEEVFEAFAETDPTKLRAELIQVAAVAVSWIEAIDRRKVN